jgi:hypothetical protein
VASIKANKNNNNIEKSSIGSIADNKNNNSKEEESNRVTIIEGKDNSSKEDLYNNGTNKVIRYNLSSLLYLS